MEFFQQVLDLFLNLDQHLAEVIQRYGTLTYGILFLIVFCETGLVVTPLLPGDSLLFAAGTFAALGDLNVGLLFILLVVAAILGDTVNYWIGKAVGVRAYHWKKRRFFNPEHLRKTHAFYERHGGKTIILARFVPIVRTFAPFVAGIGVMTYPKFLLYNVVGALAWVAICLFAGYFFGNLPIVKEHFELAILTIIFLSILPMLIEYGKHRLSKSRKPPSESNRAYEKEEGRG